MKRTSLILLIGLVALLLIGAGTLVALYRYTQVVDRAVVSVVNRLAGEGIHVSYADLSGNLFGRIRIDQPQVVFGDDTLRATRLDLDYSLLDVAQGRYIVNDLALIDPYLRLSLVPDTADAPDTPFSFEALSASLDLQSWPDIVIGRLLIDNGRIDIAHGKRVEQFRYLATELEARITPEVVKIEPYYLRGRWINQGVELDDLTFKLTGSAKRITLNQFEANLPGIHLVAHGEWEFQPAPRLLFFADTSHVDVPIIRSLWPELPFETGDVTLYGSVIGTRERFSGELFLGGQLDDIRVERLRSDYSVDGDSVALENLSLRSSVGRLDGRLHMYRDGGNLVNLRFDDLDLEAMHLVATPLRFSGRLESRFTNWRWSDMTGTARGRLTDIVAGPSRIDTLQVAVAIEPRRLVVREGSHVTVAPQSRFDISGTLGKNLDANLSVRTRDNDLGRLTERLGLAGWKGVGALRVDVSGPIGDPSIAGTVEIDSLLYGSTVVYGIYGSADVGNVATRREGYFDLELATGFVGDLFLTSGLVQMRFQDNRIDLDPLQFYSEENSIVSRGSVVFGETDVTVRLPEFNVSYGAFRVVNEGVPTLRVGADSLIVESFTLSAGDSGTVLADGYLAFNGRNRFYAEVTGLPLEPLNQYLYLPYTFGGMVERTELYLGGTMDEPEADLITVLERLSLDDLPIGRLVSDVSLRDQALAVNTINFEGRSDSYFTVNGTVNLLLAAGADSAMGLTETPLSLNVVFGGINLQDYSAFYDVNYPIEGELEGRIDLSGDVRNPRGQITFQGRDLRFQDYDFPSLSVDGRLQSDRILIDLARVNFEDTDVMLNGEKPIAWDPENLGNLLDDRRFRLRASIREDSLNFLGSVNPELERLTGDIQVSALLEGTFDDPVLSEATASVVDGTLYLSKLENSIQEVQLAAHMEGDWLVIDEMTARSPKEDLARNFFQRMINRITRTFFPQKEKGEIRVAGRIRLDDVIRPRLDLRVDLDEAYFNYFLENTRVVVSSSDLTVTGRDTLLVAGDITVEEGDLTLDFVESEKNLLFSPTVRESPPFLSYDLDVDILPNFFVRSEDALNNFDIKLSGDVRVRQEPRSVLEIYGFLETTGKYYVQGEEFSIQSGKIDFIDPKALPELNIFAQTQKNGLTFRLNVRGPLDAPDKELTILDDNGNLLPYPDVKDQMALLLFGVEFDQLAAGTDSLLLQKGDQILTQALVSKIEQEARSFTGLDQVRLQNQDSFFSNRLNRPASLALGKYLTPNLYLEYNSQLGSSGLGNIPAPQLSWEAGSRVFLQYRLDRNWSFSSIYEKTEEGNDRVKLDINWEIEF